MSRFPFFATMPKMAHHPPRDDKLMSCTEYVQQMLSSWIPGFDHRFAEVF